MTALVVGSIAFIWPSIGFVLGPRRVGQWKSGRGGGRSTHVHSVQDRAKALSKTNLSYKELAGDGFHLQHSLKV